MTQARQMMLTEKLFYKPNLGDEVQIGKKTAIQYQDIINAAKRANELMLPVQTSDSGTGQAVVVASNDNRNVNTHHGDFVFPKLDVNHSDSTARAFTEYRMA